MSSEDVKAEEIFLSCKTDNPEKSFFFFFFQHERGEEKNCFLNPTIEQVVVIRRLYKSRKKNLLSFSLFSGVFNNLDAPHCWGEIRKCQLMLRFLMIETHGTMFGQSLFASKLFFFFFTVLVSAKDEYEQYFLLNKKKCRMYGENFFSVYVSRLDRWGKSSWQDASSIFS